MPLHSWHANFCWKTFDRACGECENVVVTRRKLHSAFRALLGLEFSPVSVSIRAFPLLGR